MASELKPCQIADALEKCDWAGASIGNKAIVSLAIEALRNARSAPVATPADATDEMVEAALAIDWDNEDERATVHNIWHAMTAKLPFSPAPAATDTGLVTVGEVSTVRESVAAFAGHMSSGQLKPGDLLCLRSQAEAIIAAERAEKEGLIHDLNRIKDHETELVNDNAALTARIKELEELLAKFADKGTLQALKDANDRAEALEAKLAAAEKALEFYANQENWKNGRFEQVDGGTVLRHYPASAHKDRGATARAALGGKPS